MSGLKAVAVILLLFAGCMDEGGERVPTTTKGQPAPTGGTLPPDQSPSGPLLNLTACNGANAKLVLPRDVVQAKLPRGFTIHEQTFGSTTLFLNMVSCGKAAASGVDVGPAHVSLAYVIVKDPRTGQLPERMPAYAFEAIGSKEILAQFAAVPAFPKPLEGKTVTTYEALPAGGHRLTSRVLTGADVWYDLGSRYYNNTAASALQLRFYRDPANLNATVDLDLRETTSTGDGEGPITSHAGSAFTQISGASAWVTFAEPVHAASMTWRTG